MLYVMKKLFAIVTLALMAAPAFGWGPQGHKLVALVAMDHLTPAARKNVKALLGPETLADVASWPDKVRPDETGTGPWHYVDIPAEAEGYDRDRDCPPQTGVKLHAPNDKLRDCVVDRILYFEGRIADPSLDNADRATALKYLVHFVGDVHQPFHAYGPEKGGNGIAVVVFGSGTCGKYPCNLHSVWDSGLILHHHLEDEQYRALLEKNIHQSPPVLGADDPALWANGSKAAAMTAVVPNHGIIDEAYYNREIVVVDRQLELGGLRLAGVLNRLFTAPPVKFRPASADSKQF